MKVAIIGGGSSAHVLAVLLSARGHEVRILTSRPNEWVRELSLEAGPELIKGCISVATADVREAMSEAVVAFLCMPVHQYPLALRRIAPALADNKDCIVGAVYGQGGFDWMMEDVCKGYNLGSRRYFAIGLLPWIARTKIYGRCGISYGPKFRNSIATSDFETFDFLQENLLNDLSVNYWGCGEFYRVPNFLTLTLTVDNQIIHPSRCYALSRQFKFWKDETEVPYFYRDFDEESEQVLKGIDDDYTSVRDALVEKYPAFKNDYMLNYLELEHWSYGSHNPDIRASFVNSQTLREIKPPVTKGGDGFLRLDAEHRFFKDDFAFGLEIAQWIGKMMGCEMLHVSGLIEWYNRQIVPRQKNPILFEKNYDVSSITHLLFGERPVEKGGRIEKQ